MTMTAKDINGNEIKVGDMVERVEYSSSCWGATEVGKTYKVVDMVDTFREGAVLGLDGVEGRYYANKFKVISSKTQPFTKSDLKDGMVVTYRDGRTRYLLDNELYAFPESWRADVKHFSSLRCFKDDLTAIDNTTTIDIVKVEYMDEVLWERDESPSKEQLRIKELEEGIAKMQEELNKLL